MVLGRAGPGRVTLGVAGRDCAGGDGEAESGVGLRQSEDPRLGNGGGLPWVGCSGGAPEGFKQGRCEEPTRMVQVREAGA